MPMRMGKGFASAAAAAGPSEVCMAAVASAAAPTLMNCRRSPPADDAWSQRLFSAVELCMMVVGLGDGWEPGKGTLRLGRGTVSRPLVVARSPDRSLWHGLLTVTPPRPKVSPIGCGAGRPAVDAVARSGDRPQQKGRPATTNGRPATTLVEFSLPHCSV